MRRNNFGYVSYRIWIGGVLLSGLACCTVREEICLFRTVLLTVSKDATLSYMVLCYFTFLLILKTSHVNE